MRAACGMLQRRGGGPWRPEDDGNRHGRRVHGLARVAYVGQRFQVPAPTNFGQPPVLNSYVDARYECFGGTSAPTYGFKKRPKRQL